VEIFDLVDQLGRNQLTAVEPASGRLRTLYPLSESVFVAGPAWFVREPESYRIRVMRDSAGGVSGLVWEEEGRTVEGERIRFTEREVAFSNDGVTLAGTLILPKGSGPHPGMVMIHGSGPVTRRGPRYVADLFADRGIAVLVYDKRGTGGSTGQWMGASHVALAGDAEAGLKLLRRQPEIDANRVGVFAASEGGYVGPLVAVRGSTVAFLICRVCPGIPHGPVILDMEANQLRNRGFSEEEVAEAVDYLGHQIDYALTGRDYDSLQAHFQRIRGAPWTESYNLLQLPGPEAEYWDGYRGLLTVDPRDLYSQLSIPILVILGEEDDRILVEKNRRALVAAGREAGNPDFTVWVLPRATHGLMEVEAGPDGEAGPFQRFVPGFHDAMIDWLLERVGSSGPGPPG
jgi:hypothetical protein